MDSDEAPSSPGAEGVSELAGGERLPKDDPVFEVLGTLDELASWLGLIKASIREGLAGGPEHGVPVAEQLERVQVHLRRIAAECAASAGPAFGEARLGVEPRDLAELERWRQEAGRVIRPPEDFVAPGGSRLAASIDVARCVCRRLERRMVAWLRRAHPEALAASPSLRYINRLSGYLFVVARLYEPA